MILVIRHGFIFLKQKGDACENFKNFKAYVEKQSEHIIKILRSNRGIKYIVCDFFFKWY